MKYDRFRLRLISSLGIILDNIEYQQNIFNQGALDEKYIKVLDLLLKKTSHIVVGLDVKCNKEDVISEIKKSIKEINLFGKELRRKRPELNKVFITRQEKDRISENEYIELQSVQGGYLQTLCVLEYLGNNSPLQKTIEKYDLVEEIQDLYLCFQVYKKFFEKEILFCK